MKFNAIAISALAGVASASPVDTRQNGGGDGPFGPGTYKTESSLQQHTIYMPSKTTGSTKMPVLVWGNGACSADGRSNVQLLQQIASYGYPAISSGGPGQQGSTTAKMMTDSIDWAVANAGKGAYANVDATKIMAAGFSCGGVEAMAQIWDSRVSTIGVISSGLLDNQTAATHFNKPVLFCPGWAERYRLRQRREGLQEPPGQHPSWKGNINVGHGGTLGDQNGGKFGKAILNWAQYVLRADDKGKAYLTDGYKADGWAVETHAFDQLKPQA
ncbi:beta xylanase [Apiospora hydei]|uniref:Beta xylanase n=1 Tax=Apiospora hydei TaxID=1337664 RepID=A0ABR1VT83_9PEZI